MNEFHPAKATANVSSIFKWYRQDFETADSRLESFLARFAPAGSADFLRNGKNANIRFQSYHWGLNDTGDVGSRYWSFYIDYLRNK